MIGTCVGRGKGRSVEEGSGSEVVVGAAQSK